MDPRGASLLSRRRMWAVVGQAVALCGAVNSAGMVDGFLKMGRYRDVKEGRVLEDRRTVKSEVRGVLKGWVQNSGDDSFELDQDVKENLISLRRE